MIKENFIALLTFELFYKMFVTILALPIIFSLLQWSMDISGYRYLDNTSILSYLMEPSTILIGIIIFIFMTMVTLIEIHAIILCYHESFHHRKIQMTKMLYGGVYKAKRMARRKNAMLILFVLLIIPLTNVAAVSGLISSIHIPEFIQDFIFQHRLLSFLFISIMLAITLVSFRWSFSLHAYTLQDDNFKDARKQSVHVLKGNYIKTVVYIVLWQVVLFVVASIVACIAGLFAMLCIKFLFLDSIGYAIAIHIVSIILFVIFSSLLYFSVPLSFSLLSALYYTYVKENDMPFEIQPITMRIKTRRRYRLLIALVVLLFCSSMFQVYSLQQRDANIIHELREVPEITAHRGDSMHAPENSIPAFMKAIEAKADWIELDVHQTKDEVVVVTHDADLKRIAGVNKKIYDLTYEELQQYDVGSWFSNEFKGLHVATLDEVIALCKGKVKLNIELKPTGNEINFEQNVINIIKRHDFISSCVLASLKKDALINVKRIEPNIQTLYIMSVALGDVSEITFADNVSIESSFITSEMLDAVHRKGKKLTAWTVNQEENVKRMIDLGVDNIISDDPSNVYQIIYEHRSSEWLSNLIALFFPQHE